MPEELLKAHAQGKDYPGKLLSPIYRNIIPNATNVIYAGDLEKWFQNRGKK